MKDKKNILIGVGVLVLAILVGGGVFFAVNHGNPLSQPTPTPATPEEMAAPTLSPSDIGLTLVPSAGRDNGQQLTLTITKVDDIASVDYELDYTVTGNIPRGVIGTLTPKNGQIQQALYFGTCSNVCHPDTGIDNIKLTLKITKTDGKIYSLQTTASLNQ